MLILKPVLLKSVFWMLVIITLFLTLMPAKEIPDALIFWDKLQHSLCFATLAFVGLFAYKNVILMCVSLSIYGILIELMQTFLTTTRHGDWLDWVADTVGVLIGALVALMLKKFYR